MIVASLLALAAGQADERCFINNDWRDGLIVPGQPNVLIWEAGGPNRDVLLNSDADSQAQFVGAIARNVSQGSVFWIPPVDIAKGNATGLFAIQLWDLENGMGCQSPAFEFAEVADDAPDENTAGPFGPFVTTAISIINTGYVTVTATAATFTSGGPIFEQAVTGSITATDGDTTTGTSMPVPTTSAASSSAAPDESDQSSGPNTVAIAVGTVGGVLVLALVVLSFLLWRVRRKRAGEKAKLESLADPKDISPMSTPESQVTEVSRAQPGPVEELDDTARHEMMGDSSAPQELDSQNVEPVELPADDLPPSYPGHCDSEVSPTSGSSLLRRSLSFDKGTFTVSPLSDRRDRKE